MTAYLVGIDSKNEILVVIATGATLYNKTAIATFEGKLQIIDMSREIKNTVATTIHDGYTYVPVEFFREPILSVDPWLLPHLVVQFSQT